MQGRPCYAEANPPNYAVAVQWYTTAADHGKAR